MTVQEFLKNLVSHYPLVAGQAMEIYPESGTDAETFNALIAQKLSALFPQDLVKDLDEKREARSSLCWLTDK